MDESDFDLILNMERLSVHEMVDLIVHFMRRKEWIG